MSFQGLNFMLKLKIIWPTFELTETNPEFKLRRPADEFTQNTWKMLRTNLTNFARNEGLALPGPRPASTRSAILN
jgi:hypothetical protein